MIKIKISFLSYQILKGTRLKVMIVWKLIKLYPILIIFKAKMNKKMVKIHKKINILA